LLEDDELELKLELELDSAKLDPAFDCAPERGK
jgi:hypothetical protein